MTDREHFEVQTMIAMLVTAAILTVILAVVIFVT